MKKVLTPDNVREVFDYNEETGQLIWKVDSNKNNLKGSVAGNCPPTQRYSRLCYGTGHSVHIVIWLWHHREWPTDTIDHKDGNKLNNRIGNLRVMTSQDNTAAYWDRVGRRPAKVLLRDSVPNHVTGVQYLKADGKYRASKHVKGKTHRFGHYVDRFDAICAVKSFEASLERARKLI